MDTMTDFDTLIDRRGSGALKYDALLERFGRDDLTPLWVADMDFATPGFILDAIRDRLDHPVMGYTVEHPDYRPAIIDWLRSLHGVEVRPEWLSFIPGIVKGIAMAINCFLSPEDKVVVMPPVYHPFYLVPRAAGRQVVWNPLVREKDDYLRMDLEGLESLLDKDSRIRMLILSNPHNPVGIVWSRKDLKRLAEICASRGVIVISDEIHSEMVLPKTIDKGKRHVPFYDVSDAARACSITFAAPSKTFNIAGIVSSYSIVPDDSMRRRFYSWLKAGEMDEPSIFSPIATVAAYREGSEWREEMLRYVEGNIDMVIDCLSHKLPCVRAVRPDAGFLVWLDCKGMNVPHEKIVEYFRDKARLALNDGRMFGPGGDCCMRLNVAAPRAVIRKAIEDLCDVCLANE